METGKKIRGKNRLFFRTLILRAAILALVWWIFAGDDPDSWWFGIPAVLLAAFSSTALRERPGLTTHFTPAAFRYIAFFVRESVLGGIDVARRALMPGMPIKPGTLWYECRLPAGAPRALFVDTTSLLPGTLSAELKGTQVLIHVLDEGASVMDKLGELENRVAGLFGLDLLHGVPGGRQ